MLPVPSLVAQAARLDLSGYVDLPDNRLAVVELSYTINSSAYDSFVVSIINTRSGEIDCKRFHFADYLDPAKRSDERRDYKGHYHVRPEDWTWFIAVPADTGPLVKAIESYVELFASTKSAYTDDKHTQGQGGKRLITTISFVKGDATAPEAPGPRSSPTSAMIWAGGARAS